MTDNEGSSTTKLLLEMLERSFGEKIKELLDDPDVVEIYLNPDGSLWEDRLGRGKNNTGIFISPEKSLAAIKLVASSVKQECNDKQPILSAELPCSKNRFQAFVYPAVEKPMFNIRKRASYVFSLDKYIADGIVTENQAQLIKSAIKDKKNIVIAGGTGTGKTTFANAVLLELSGTRERLGILEQTNELQCRAEDYFILREHKKYAPMDELLHGVLRSSPNRIIVGEVRGGEAYTLLKAWNTGHPGGLATLHANSAKEVFERLEAMIQEAKVEPSPRMIAQALDMILYLERTEIYSKNSDGKTIFNTVLKDIVFVEGYDKKQDQYIYNSVGRCE